MRIVTACLLALLVSAPLAAQSSADPAGPDEPYAASARLFFLATDQNFAAKTTLNAAFGKSVEPFFGGGIQVVIAQGVFIEFGVSRFKKTGQRAFINNGQTFQLGIPLTATITPLELSGGYRFFASSRFIPYAGAGIGRYGYREESDFAAAGDNVDTHHAGYLAVGGVEIRLHRWVGVAVDAQYTHITGILGTSGVSKDAGESDLGGVAGRFKVLIGR